MRRVFLDANVLFSAAYRENAGVARIWTRHDVERVTSDYAEQEARSNLDQPEQIRRLDKRMRSVTLMPHPTMPPQLPAAVNLPDKDVSILQAALACGATVLITGDIAHFGCYFGKPIAGVRIVPPAMFLREPVKDRHETNEEAEVVDRIRAAGADAHVTKSAAPENLIRAIRACVAARATQP